MKTTSQSNLIICFVAAFAATSLIPTQIITMENFSICIAFYFSVFLAGLVLGNSIGLPILKSYLSIPFCAAFCIATFIHITSSEYIRSELYFDPPPISAHGASFLLMNEYFIWAKPFDVLAQQGLIFILYHKLADWQNSLRRIQVIFIFIFGIPHIFQTLLTETIVGVGFATASIGAAIIFPYLLKNVTLGPALCFLIHLLAYSMTAMITWSFFAASGFK